MNKLNLLALAMLGCNLSFGQYNTPWLTSQLNTVQLGYIGVGTKSTSGATNLPLPNFNFHVHGTVDYLEDVTSVPSDPTERMLEDHGAASSEMTYKSATNFGKTARIGMTNLSTGMASTDGVVFRLSENDFVISNREAGNMTLSVPGVGMHFANGTKRIWVGGTPVTNTTYGKFNIVAYADNGLYLETMSSAKSALTIRSKTLTDDAIQVMGINGTTRNFAVRANGEVYARKYTTTLASIPDYVFDPMYKLMPLGELRGYLQANRHLPNVPSAKEYAEEGVDLGEMNRILLEKIEELTLYTLQLEERMKALEEKK